LQRKHRYMEILDLARRTPQSHAKRQREQAKKEKRRAKEEKKALRKAQKTEGEGDGDLDEASPDSPIREEEPGVEESQQLPESGAPG